MAERSRFLKLIGGLWRVLDGLRRVLHLLLLSMLVVVLFAVIAPEQIIVPRSAALVIAPTGTLVDELSGDPLDRALAELQGSQQSETLLRDLVDAIDAAADDPRIAAMYLRLDALGDSGLSKLQELASAIRAFKATGKPVIAAGDSFSRDQYYLGAQADELYLNPMGVVLVEGYGRYIPYFKSALDAIYVDYELWTAGEYKSFTEPYKRDDMSPEDREASQAYLDVLWTAYKSDVAAARELPPEAMQRYADEFVPLLQQTNGNAAAMALDFGLVDELMTRGAINDRLLDIVGGAEGDADQFSGIGHESYLAHVRTGIALPDGEDRVAVVTLSGTIQDGRQSPGSIGGDSAADLIRSVARDEDVKALVLRVDSPGGSAFASEIILSELEEYQASGRPLVVSMGSVAASGGYWVSMSADEIWASETTITGSIGVGAAIPTFPRTLDKVGIHVDGIGTTELSGQFSQARGLGDDARAYIGETVRALYGEFVAKVADHREREYEEVEAVAQGRVWSGRHAREFGLVDELGGLDDAIVAAAGLAGLAEGSYAVDYAEPELTFSEQLALQFTQTAAPVLRRLRFEWPWSHEFSASLAAVTEPLEFLQRMQDPRGVYAYCFCDVD